MKDLYDPQPSVEPWLGLTICPNIPKQKSIHSSIQLIFHHY